MTQEFTEMKNLSLVNPYLTQKSLQYFVKKQKINYLKFSGVCLTFMQN